MKALALWRCTGSAAPGGYSTLIIVTSFPGTLARSLVINSLTLAASSAEAGRIGLKNTTAPIETSSRNRERGGIFAQRHLFTVEFPRCLGMVFIITSFYRVRMQKFRE